MSTCSCYGRLLTSVVVALAPWSPVSGFDERGKGAVALIEIAQGGAAGMPPRSASIRRACS